MLFRSNTWIFKNTYGVLSYSQSHEQLQDQKCEEPKGHNSHRYVAHITKTFAPVKKLSELLSLNRIDDELNDHALLSDHLHLANCSAHRLDAGRFGGRALARGK